MPLRKYADLHQPIEREPSGVACSEMLCAQCNRSHNAGERVLSWWNDDHEKHEKPCLGEMMYDMPRRQHPELSSLQSARCDYCGWRGWC